MGKLIYGVAINDADYKVTKEDGGKQVWICPYYRKWMNMLVRCYGYSEHKRRPSYSQCFVSQEWLNFSNFKNWMENQDWQGKELDKDLLVVGNKEYSKETCIFVTNSVNQFTKDRSNCRGEFMIGASWHKGNKKFISSCRDFRTGKVLVVGYFTTEIEAHKAWRKRKHELACQLADLQTDIRVAEALRLRYL